VFSAQKGATEEIQKRLEEGMHRIAGLYSEAFPLGLDVSHLPGAGSAGGLTGGIVAATGAKIKRVRRRPIAWDCYDLPPSHWVLLLLL
jgi:glycerate kinase